MGWWTVLPPLVAIAVVIWRKEVILALFAAILTSEILLLTQSGGFAPLLGFIASIDRITAVFDSSYSTRLLMFSLLIGALLAYMRHSGGVTALVDFLINRKMTNSRRQAGLLSFGVGIILFIESNLSILTSGILSRGIYDRFGISRERLAYVIDSTSAPVCIILLFNGWGAYVLGLLGGYDLQNPVQILIGSVVFNFYAWIALAIVLFTIVTDKVHGPMRKFEAKSVIKSESKPEFTASKPRFMIVPLLVLIIGIFGFMFWTGDGELIEGDGARSILYATVLASLTAYLMMLSSKRFTHVKLVKIGFGGMGELLPLVSIVLISMALGSSLGELGTGKFIAGMADETLPRILIVPMLFLAGAIMSFATGTSWGTFALLIPIGVPLMQTMGLPPALVMSAILGGGVFGDHCSPISDTSVVSALAAGCDLLDHVRTQLPYALVGGGLTFVFYLIVGMFIL
ncbi:MAG: sodium:proton antiporter [Robiginitomaculum sp.]|nr:sodium:proton antiporter [Robiginitomaculum sp.]